MSPVPSTTRPQVQKWNLWDLNPRPYSNIKILFMSIPKGPVSVFVFYGFSKIHKKTNKRFCYFFNVAALAITSSIPPTK